MDLSCWTPCDRPSDIVLEGRYIRVEPYKRHHMLALCQALADQDIWTWLPFTGADDFEARFEEEAADWVPFVFRRTSDDRVVGTASYMRIREAHGSLEVGCVIYSPQLKRTREATEAMFLMARHVFEELGYRRYEWKCNALNMASRSAALRLGFTEEGLFRQDAVVKGQNRDTAWFSMLDHEWPSRATAMRNWLADDNFDGDGRQIRSLAACHS